MNDIINLIAPVRILKFIKEFCIYIVVSIFRNWISFIVLTLLIILAFYLLNLIPVLYNNYLYFLAIPIVFIVGIRLVNDFKPIRFTEQFTAGEVECIYLTDNDHFEKNLITDKINEESNSRINRINQNSFPFAIGLAKYRLITFPKFYYYLISLKKLYDIINSKVESDEIQSVLLILINAKNNKVNIKFFLKKNTFSHGESFQEFADLINKVEIKETDTENFIGDLISFYQAIISHGFLDLMIDSKSFKEAHRLLDENQGSISKSLLTIKGYSLNESKQLIERVEKKWSCEIERYRGIVYMVSENFNSALTHIFAAIKINPYYPFDDYESWKSELIKNYAISFANTLGELEDETDSDIERSNSKEEIDIALISTFSQLSFPGIVSYTDLLLGIYNQANSSEITKYLEKELETEICESPIQDYIKGEVLKYLPLEGEMINKLYVGRIDKSYSYFTKVLELEPLFPSIHNKIGALLLFKNIYEDKIETDEFEKTKYHLDRGFEILNKYGLVFKKSKTH